MRQPGRRPGTPELDTRQVYTTFSPSLVIHSLRKSATHPQSPYQARPAATRAKRKSLRLLHLTRATPHLLKHRAVVAHVDARQDARAARQASHHIGHKVAVQVWRHLPHAALI